MDGPKTVDGQGVGGGEQNRRLLQRTAIHDQNGPHLLQRACRPAIKNRQTAITWPPFRPVAA